MAASRRSDLLSPSAHRVFLGGLTRAFGGATVFALPLLLTMEMWWLGFTAEPARLALLLVVLCPMLVGLSYRVGFEETSSVLEDVLDAMVAIAVATITAAVFLAAIGVLEPATMAWDEIAGKLAVQVVPGSIGALMAQSLLAPETGAEGEERSRRQDTYVGEVFLMCVGALFLALPVAPTEEIVMIAYRLESWRAIALVLISLGVMHAFVYGGGFRGTPDAPEGTPAWSLFLRFTVVGYAITLAVCAYVLWTFGSLDGTSLAENLNAIIVLAFPGSIGAAAARLLI